MANNVTLLSYANTFGDWVINTNQLAQEIDNLGKGNYTKDTGLLVINSSGTGLQVSNNSLFTGNVVISGVGQALQVTHDAVISGNLTVVGNTTFSGYEIDLSDITSNTMHANAATFGTATINGDLTVAGNTNINLTEIVTGNLTVNGTLSGNGFANLQNSILGSALALSIALG